MATYNPSNPMFTGSNKPYATSGQPDTAKSWFYDQTTGVKRPFNSITEILGYFDTANKRKGVIGAVLVDEDGAREYWWPDPNSLTDEDLVLKFIETDLSNYYTQQQTNDLLDDKAAVSGQNFTGDISATNVSTPGFVASGGNKGAMASDNISRSLLAVTDNDIDAPIIYLTRGRLQSGDTWGIGIDSDNKLKFFKFDATGEEPLYSIQLSEDASLETMAKEVVPAINEVNDALDLESSNREVEDQNLSDSIYIETNRAISAETILQQNIDKSLTLFKRLVADGTNTITDSTSVGQFPKFVTVGGQEYAISASVNSETPKIVQFDMGTGVYTFPRSISASEDVGVLYSQSGDPVIIPSSLVTKQQAITVDTLSASSSQGDNRVIIPELYTVNATVNVTWTSALMQFQNTRVINELTIPVSVSGDLMVYVANISPLPLVVNSSIAVFTGTYTVPCVNGVNKYAVNIPISAGQFLLFRPTVAGLLKYRNGVPVTGKTIARLLSGTGTVISQIVANSELGIGWTVAESNEYLKKEMLIDLVEDNTVSESEIDSKIETLEDISITTKTLDAEINIRSITPSSFTSLVAVNQYWTDNELYFEEDEIVQQLTIRTLVDAILTIVVGEINPRNPFIGSTSFLTYTAEYSLNLIANTFDYNVNIPVPAGNFLIFMSDVSTSLYYRSGQTGKQLARLAGKNTGSLVTSIVNNGQLGVGYVCAQKPIYYNKLQLIDFIREYQNTSGFNPMFGQKLVVISDSMGKGNGLPADQVYGYQIAQRNGMTYLNLGINGNLLTDNTGGSGIPMVNRLADIPLDTKYLIIDILTNDAAQGKPIGTENSTDKSTVYGAMNYSLEYIQTQIPDIKIIWIGIYPRPQTIGYQSYFDAAKIACRNHGIYIVDNISEATFDWDNAAQTTLLRQPDSYHLNANGHYREGFRYEGNIKSKIG